MGEMHTWIFSGHTGGFWVIFIKLKPLQYENLIWSSFNLGLTQKAALPLFKCFAKKNLPQMRQKAL
jgi:hypothetical protein